MSTPSFERAPGKPRAPTARSAPGIAGLVLVLVPGTLLAGSAIAKFAGLPGVVRQMAAAGFDGPKLTFIASLEIISAALILLPRTRPLGLLLVSAYLGGAICSHVQAGDYAHGVPASILLALVWIGSALLHGHGHGPRRRSDPATAGRSSSLTLKDRV
jgi:uncharacterized membrane protein YphA (DoxX/SURF4 family)